LERFVVDRFLTFTAVAMVAACGSSSSPMSPAPTPSGPAVTISATGFSPLEITIPVGARVTFVNSDRLGHEISSGIDHNVRECPEVDVIGFLGPGQSRGTGTFDQPKTCRFHDHAKVGIAAYQGRIVVQ
jgi:plastocyanin